MKKNILTYIFCIIMVPYLVSSCLASCMNSKKFQRYANEHKKELAEKCAKEFPAQEKTDSTGFNQSKAIIDSLLSAQQVERILTESERLALLDDLERLQAQPIPDCDSISEGLFRLSASDKKKIDQLEKQNAQLALAIKNVKPVQVKVRDTAVESLLEMQLTDMSAANQRLSLKLESVTADLNQAKKDRNKWRLLFFGLLGLNGLYAVMKIRGKLPF